MRGESRAGHARRPFHLALVVVLLWATVAGAQEGKVLTVRPQETDEILANPGMGWETFHETSRTDRNLPAWIPSTVHYARWGWGRFEPRAGEIDHAFLDNVLKETRAAGQRLAFRVMCCSTTPGVAYFPKWIKEVGGRVLDVDYEGQEGLEIPDLDDPAVLSRHLDFVRRLGERYDGHPDIDHLDIGSVGWWGEWHMSGSKTARMPKEETLRKVVDAYTAAFKKTPLLMTLESVDVVRRAVDRGAGWRADCLGDLGMFANDWSHMRDAYPMWIRQYRLEGNWKNAPVAFETCADMRRWVKQGWSLRHIFNYALALHASFLNNKSAPLPEAPHVRAEVERFLRRLGYRLVLRKLTCPAEVRPGAPMELSMDWQNTGSAPCYRPCRVAYRLEGENGYSKVLVGKVTVNRWMPGSVELFTEGFFKMPADLPNGQLVEVKDVIEIPADAPAGNYALSIAVVGESRTEPVVRLGIKGRGEDGWYPMGRVVVR